jgi:hypothetical protein
MMQNKIKAGNVDVLHDVSTLFIEYVFNHMQ